MKFRTAYADEHGDAGYQFQSGSSSLFVLSILLPHRPESLLNRVIAARRQLSKPETFEFHFHESNAQTRRRFFESITDEQIGLLVAVIHKENAPLELRRLGKVGLYVHALSGLVLRSPVAFEKTKLHLDGTGSQKEFVQSLKNEVRDKCRTSQRREQNFNEIRILNSTHPLIQCADMLAGAATAQIERGQSEWLAMLQCEPYVWWEEKFQDKE